VPEDTAPRAQALENRTLDSKREMDIMNALDEMQSLNKRHERVDTAAALAALQRSAESEQARAPPAHAPPARACPLAPPRAPPPPRDCGPDWASSMTWGCRLPQTRACLQGGGPEARAARIMESLSWA